MRDQHSFSPEKVASWYFRLNGFLQIENFVVHPRHRGSQRTDADLLGVRFPYRAERLFDDPDDIMLDEVDRLSLSHDQVDVVVAEVKSGRCALNGPWTERKAENIQRVIAAIGCLPREYIDHAAADLYAYGVNESELGLRIRLVAVGRERSPEVAESYPGVTQLTFAEILDFMWTRLGQYRRQKRQTEQWDWHGRAIKQLVDEHRQSDEFVSRVLGLMQVRRAD